MKKIIFSLCISAAVIFPVVASAATFEHDLYVGIYDNAEVKMLQEFLHTQGLYDGPVNGNFFSLTKQAVVQFQKKEGITPSEGYVGSKTRARINMFAGKPTLSRDEQIAALQAQIQALQEQIAALIAKQQAPTTAPLPSPSPSLSPPPLPSPSATSTPAPGITPPPIAQLLISGSTTQSFSDIGNIPIKLGDITISNTTDHDILFAQFKFDMYDGMNSSLNRNKTVLFKIRNGTTTYDDLISKTNYLVNNTAPPLGSDIRRQLDVSFPVLIKSGQTRVTSLWLENLDYVVGGYLHVNMLNAFINDGITPQ